MQATGEAAWWDSADAVEARRWAEALDLAALKRQLIRAGWPVSVTNEVQLEYRRFLWLAWVFKCDPRQAPPLINACRRQHQANVEKYAKDVADIFNARSGSSLNDQVLAQALREAYEARYPSWEMTYWDANDLSDLRGRGADRSVGALPIPPDRLLDGPSPSQRLSIRPPPSDLAAARDQLSWSKGFVDLEGIFGSDIITELSREARESRSAARPWGSQDFHLGRAGRVTSPRQHLTAGPGSVLLGLHENVALTNFVSALAGARAYPTRASYVHYRPGDFVGLHTDVSPCAVTLVISVFGDTDPLIVHPELAQLDPRDLMELAVAKNGFPPGGSEVRVPRDGVLVLRGSRVPHARPQSERAHSVATLCYATL